MSDTRTSTASAELFSQALDLTPGGVHSNVRLASPKVFFARGQGSRLWDVDGNDYVDYLLGQGPMFLGHAPVDINDAVALAVSQGMVFGAEHPLEVEAAAGVLGTLGWAERVRFGLTGTEAVQAALRLARAATGRTRFVRFEGHYHGWLDNVLLGPDPSVPASAGQLASHLGDSIVIPWNDADALESLLATRHDEVAAVIMEPVMFNMGAVLPRDGYLQKARELCDRYGIVLIFDEVISGFRVGPQGAVGLTGVVPDLATYGKAIAGGWPVAALAGSERLMGLFGTGEVNHSGTFNSSVMACAAVAATMTRLRENPPYAELERVGTSLREGLDRLASRHGLPLHLQGLPMAFHASLGGPDGEYHDYRGLASRDLAGYAALSTQLAEHGVWVAGRGIWYVSAAHTDDDVAETLDRVDSALAAR
ncbi:aminotransferase class III-fold pyridoxal phosphate-dependent enzyme [Herbiconiux sp. KACC 21604]|uniref:aspartate aminotransferase family protein n=1 Tax=unclassified Herbiconiux TaxID=2618217 RepID=UPI001490A8A6|nr:aminotransferase class III-fold pyridoxal phosphate-dependent enzyme [Herbiconiux sp. SALV-R1]QJU55042.1 aminotransferase class III-fold pyridoxal phosphate-dependent enzyme [Herbiconiux sp. SALV-R1]WPO86182.1 aminotransferase class III-fold pyridoxal phosphate-dependent enzyme [Herbiconiux sp. KACC 21604]